MSSTSPSPVERVVFGVVGSPSQPSIVADCDATPEPLGPSSTVYSTVLTSSLSNVEPNGGFNPVITGGVVSITTSEWFGGAGRPTEPSKRWHGSSAWTSTVHCPSPSGIVTMSPSAAGTNGPGLAGSLKTRYWTPSWSAGNDRPSGVSKAPIVNVLPAPAK